MQGELISKAEAARRWDVSAARVSQMTAPGGKLHQAVTPDGKLDWSLAQQLRAATADETKTAAPASIIGEDEAFKAARARKVAAEADMAERQSAMQRGELVRVAEVDRRVGTLFGDVRDKVLGASIRCAQRTMTLATERERAAAIEDELERVFLDLADSLDRVQ